MKTTYKAAARTAVGLCGAVLVAVAFGFVQSRITVESRDGRRATRRVSMGSWRGNDRDIRVRLVRRLSDAPCVEGRTWGFRGNEIWVDRGCRAEFEISTNGRWDNNRDGDWNRRNGGRWDNGRWGNDRNRTIGDYREVRVESNGSRRSMVRIDTRGGVRLVRQLSDAPCVEGRTWGYDRTSIWTSRGCRAVFQVRAR